MHLHRLRLAQFKSYEQLELEFSPAFNAITGKNGIGKTNILDAIHYLCVAKSHFHNSDRPSLRRGADYFRIEGDFCLPMAHLPAVDGAPFAPFRFQQIACKYITQPKAKKTISHDGKAYEKLSEHIGAFPVVCIAPDDTRLITEGSAERRQFMDFSLSQLDSEYMRHLLYYNRTLEQRSALLRDIDAQRYNSTDELLLIYAQQLSAAAAVIYSSRRRFVEQLQPLFEHYYRLIAAGNAGNTPQETVSITYTSDLKEQEGKSLFELLEQNVARDKAAGRTTIGTHLDDIVFLLSEQPARQAASQGQRKTYLLALKFAQYALMREHNPQRRPLLLLDDLFDKLDQDRTRYLLHLIAQRDQFGQVFLTDTNAERLQPLLEELDRDYRLFPLE